MIFSLLNSSSVSYWNRTAQECCRHLDVVSGWPQEYLPTWLQAGSLKILYQLTKLKTFSSDRFRSVSMYPWFNSSGVSRREVPGLLVTCGGAPSSEAACGEHLAPILEPNEGCNEWGCKSDWLECWLFSACKVNFILNSKHILLS